MLRWQYMTEINQLQTAAALPWAAFPDSMVAVHIPSMLSLTERKMLQWFAARVPLDQRACVVDAGAFLGGSTYALAAGLRERGKDHRGRLFVYDMFVAPNHGWSLERMPGRRPGQSVRDIFDRNLAEQADLIDVHSGDFLDQVPPDRPIALLFVDIAKTWEINDRIVAQYFSRLIPGTSIVIQQDYNDHSCPWVNMTMARFADHFEYVCDDSGSRVFRYWEPIASAELRRPLCSFSRQERAAMMRRAIADSRSELSLFFNKVTAAWLMFEDDGAPNAISYLETISSDQPWQSALPYATEVAGTMRMLKDADGLRRHQASFFTSLP
jgi:hypothetical protein